MAAAGKWKLYEAAKLAIANGEIDFNGHSFKIALFLSTSNCDTLSGTTGISNLTNQVATNYGYDQNTKAVTIATSQVGGTTTVDETSNPVWTISGGSVSARFAVIYDDTHASKQAVCVCLLDTTPADITVDGTTTDNTLTITMSTSGLFTFSGADSN